MRIRPFRIFRLGYFIVRQAVLQRALAKFGQITQARQHNIGGHTVELRRAASDAIEFLDGQFQCAILVGMIAKQRREPADWENRLYRSFSERVFVADNHGAPVILQSSRKNFAGGRALAAGQDDQRSGISDAGVGIGRYPDTSIIVFRLNDRARFQKQPSE